MPGLPRPRRRVGAAEYQREFTRQRGGGGGEYVMPRRFSREWDRLERISDFGGSGFFGRLRRRRGGT
jgi:hypothetical protein